MAAPASEPAATGTAAEQRVCAFDQKPSNSLKLCSGCGEVSYCSKEHQREHWPVHKLQCKGAKKDVAPPVSGSAAVAGPAPIGEVEVLFEDQQRINRFGALNGRLLEVEQDIKSKQSQLDNAKDAVNEAEVALDDDSLRLRIGEVFVDIDSDAAGSQMKKLAKKLKKDIADLNAEKATIATESGELKTTLYAKFGKQINLETPS